MPSGIHVLCVDDDPDLRSLTATALERAGGDLAVTTAECARDALSHLTGGGGDVDCIVSDYDMPGMDGLEFLAAVREREPELPFILFTGNGSEEIASDAISAGVTDYLKKGGGTDRYAVLANRIENAVERRRTARARRRSERELDWYRTLIELAPIKLFAIDEEATIVWANDEYAAEFAESRDELIGTPFPTLVERGYYREEAVSRYLDEVRTLLSSGNDVEKAKYEVRFRTRSGEERIYDVHTRLLPLDDGEFAGTIHALRDVTQRNRYRAELERQNERLEEFASVVSHDLRNPLNVAQGTLESHADECSLGDGSLERIEWSLERMDELIEDLLSLARHGRDADVPEPVDFARLVRGAWEAVDTADATLECSVEGTITADEGRVRELFENLFRNAVEHGGDDVTVTVGPLSKTDANGFYVADDGAGFRTDPDEAFAFGHTTADDGTGFGLGIVEQIATAHGWTVTARDDDGARFEFREVTLHENDPVMD